MAYTRIRYRSPWHSIKEVEYVALEWIDCFNTRRLLEIIGNIPSAEFKMAYYQQQKESADAQFDSTQQISGKLGVIHSIMH